MAAGASVADAVPVALAATAEASSGFRPAAMAAARAVWEAAATAEEAVVVERLRLVMVFPEVGP